MPSPDPERLGILRLLDQENSSLQTPDFQRTFAWEKQQVDEFWGDLRRALDAQPTDDYFLGLIVLDEKDEIQDGQQRLATTLLFAAEINERIERAKEAGKYDSRIATDAAGAVTPALRQSPTDSLRISLQDQEILLNRAGIRGDSPESNRRLVKARERLGEHLDADLAKKGKPDTRLARLRQWGLFLRQEAYVVILRVPTKDAHNIFETLNTRGVRLSNGDLTKSHLISRAATDPDLAIVKWKEVTDALKDGKGRYEDDLESFLLHFHGSRFGSTKKAELFSSYREQIADQDPLDALDELIESAKLYRTLAAPMESASDWSKIGAGTQHAIDLLNAFNLKQLRYLLLSVLRDLGKGESAKAQRRKQREAILKITAWSVRGLVFGRTGGSPAERTYVEAASKIRAKTVKNVGQLRKHFVEHDMLSLDDNLFEKKFKAFAFDRPNSHRRARVVLHALEYQEVDDKAGLQPRETLTVEHVLPMSPAPGQWEQFSEEERTAFTYELGNLLLIDGPSRANEKLANKEWDEKKELIRDWGQQTPLTVKALRVGEWTTNSIQNRTKRLAKLAVETWPI